MTQQEPKGAESSTPAAESAPAQSAPAARPSFIFLAVLTVINVVADLASKGWAKERLEMARGGDREMVIIPDFMSFIYAENRGGAWGLLQGETESLRRPFFLIVSVAAIVFIISLYNKLEPEQRALKWGLPLVLGGALGNLVDRIRYGYVVDFIDCYTKMDGKVEHWPTFNVADIAICVGVGLMAIDMFTSRKKTVAGPAGEAAAADAEQETAPGQEAASPGVLPGEAMLVLDNADSQPPVVDGENAPSGGAEDAPTASTPSL